MSRRLPTALRVSMIAIAASVPICWAVLGVAAAQWLRAGALESPLAVRGFGPAALLADAIARTSPERLDVVRVQIADPDAPSAPADCGDCVDATDVAAPLAPESPLALLAPLAPSVHLAGYAWASDSEDFRFAILDPEDEVTVTMSDQSDWKRFEWLKAQARGPFVWFWLDGAEHTSDDAQVVADVRAAMKPIELLGQKQGKLGAKQGQLGARQGRIGARLGMMSARLAQLQVQAGLAGDRDAASQRDIAALQREIETISRQQRPLGDEMGRLGAEMGRLGSEMGRVSEQAKKAVRLRLERAVREGRAERLHADA